MNVLQIKDLSKAYGIIKAVDKLNLTISAGQIYGILGPNGSGKTTTLGMLTGVLHPDSGSFSWFDGKYKNPYKKIGTILETPNFFPYLNADENLEIVRHIKGSENKNFDEILSLVNLKGRRKSKFSSYSLGMKQRLAIAATLVGDPEVLIFDEPTNGLDPQGIADVRRTLKDVAESGRTVILASHMLDEVEKICTHVAIIKNGVLLKTGSVGSILSNDKTIQIASNDDATLENWLRSNPRISSIKKDGFYFECKVDEEYEVLEISKALSHLQIYSTHLVVKNQNLEAEFLQIISKA
ncbi:UNVERIFIED_CONTAM: hypothetical protein GTU68_034315 [Idotea baltica]|nr:hypothetical protein [Idotea baltica]